MPSPAVALKILEEYANTTDPSTIPPEVRLKHTATTLTIFDAYPKAKFHFLILLRPGIKDVPQSALPNLGSLLQNTDKEVVRGILKDLEDEANEVRLMIEDEQRKQYGHEWEVYIGFHAVPSMAHVHLHVISSDFISPALKNKKHWNSFHPQNGFFLHLRDVQSWLDLPKKEFEQKAKLPASEYEPILKRDLACHQCDEEFKTIPKLKAHLEEHFEQGLKPKPKSKKRTASPVGKEEDDSGKRSKWIY